MIHPYTNRSSFFISAPLFSAGLPIKSFLKSASINQQQMNKGKQKFYPIESPIITLRRELH